MKVTFLGLGIMGSRMAGHLADEQVDLTVWNRSPGPAAALGERGAHPSPSLKQAVSEADVVFTMLSNPEVVEELAFGQDGFVAQMGKDCLWVDCSTVNPSFTRRMEIRAKSAGIRYLEAPVAGSKPHAANRQLSFFVGGNESELEEVRPLLEMMGQKILHLGDVGMGASLKMLVNAMLAQSMLIFSETVLLGEKMGLDRDFLLNTLPGLPVIAPFTQAKAEMVRAGNYEVEFPLELMQKDLALAAQTAYEVEQPLLLANLAKEIFAQAKQNGLGREDFAAVHKFLEGKG